MKNEDIYPSKCNCNCKLCKSCKHKTKKQLKYIKEYYSYIDDKFNMNHLEEFNEAYKKFSNLNSNQAEFIAGKYKKIRENVIRSFRPRYICNPLHLIFMYNHDLENQFYQNKLSNDWNDVLNQSDISNFSKEDVIKHLSHFECALCHKCVNIKEITLDHDLPEAKQGKFTLENLQPSHLWCNQNKSNKCIHQSLIGHVKNHIPLITHNQWNISNNSRHIWVGYEEFEGRIIQSATLSFVEVRCKNCFELIKLYDASKIKWWDKSNI